MPCCGIHCGGAMRWRDAVARCIFPRDLRAPNCATTATSYFHFLLPLTTATYYCHLLLPPTTATYYWLLATGYWLLASGWLLHATCYMLHDAGFKQLASNYGHHGSERVNTTRTHRSVLTSAYLRNYFLHVLATSSFLFATRYLLFAT